VEPYDASFTELLTGPFLNKLNTFNTKNIDFNIILTLKFFYRKGLTGIKNLIVEI
jgi:hypothetical protein